MKKFCLILLVIFIFGEMLDDDKQCGTMNMSGGKVQGVDEASFGIGKDARVCPVTGKAIKPGQEVEAVLSNGKRIMMCCPDCQKTIEGNLKKYASLMY